MQVNNRPNVMRQLSSGNSASANKMGSRNVSGQKNGDATKSAEHKSEEQQQAMSGDSSFSDPMADAETLMRAIIANMPGKSEQKAEKQNAQSPAEQKALAKITEQFQSRFADNASNKEAFHELMQKSFGDQYDQGKAEEIRQQTLDGDFSWMPEVKLVDAETLTNTSGPQAGATGLGAYSKDDDTIFLSRDLLASDPAKAEEILTEEIGHALDARINVNDAAGDEGNIFSRLSHGDEISTSELAELRSENDSGTIMVEGREVEVEFFLKKRLRKSRKVSKRLVKPSKKESRKLVKPSKKASIKSRRGSVKPGAL